MLADAGAECHNAGTTATSVLEIFGVIQKGELWNTNFEKATRDSEGGAVW
jgi:hypothetical protein